MSAEKNWQFELEEYIKQGEPGQIEKSEAWQTAIGLQAVDGLKTSAYLLDTAKEHIEGKISIDEAQKRIQSYYEQRTDRTEVENNTKEADIVSARIAKLLGEKAFQFSPAEWLTIHRRLFEGVFTHAGQIRQYNIIKKECIKAFPYLHFCFLTSVFSLFRSKVTELLFQKEKLVAVCQTNFSRDHAGDFLFLRKKRLFDFFLGIDIQQLQLFPTLRLASSPFRDES